MNIYVQERKTGKTTRCIKISRSTGYPILCSDNNVKKIVKETAKRLNISIPEPLDVSEILKVGMEPEYVIVDELESVLNKCLPFKIVAATHTNNLKFSDIPDIMLLDKKDEKNEIEMINKNIREMINNGEITLNVARKIYGLETIDMVGDMLVVNIDSEYKDNINIGDLIKFKDPCSGEIMVKVREKFKIVESDCQDPGIIYFRGEYLNGSGQYRMFEFEQEDVIEHYKIVGGNMNE